MSNENRKIFKPHEGFQEQFVRSNVDFVVGGGSMGGGKAQPLDSLVCTPFGFRRMGDLKVGDIISNTKGGMQKVIQIYERGKLPTVEFTFSDGRSVKCTYDHLWKARRVMANPKRYILNGRNDEDLWEIMTTEQIIKILDAPKRNKVFIPMCNEVQFTRGNRTQGLTIHPYVLGCLLGDGCISSTQSKPRFYSEDVEIVNRIKSLGYDIRKSKNSDITYTIYDDTLKKALIQKQLWGKLAYDKSIPDVYKFSTIEDRKELLKGLFDTDGYTNKNTMINFSVVSKQLAEDVAWIIRSLGGYASISEREGSYKNDNGDKVICKTVYCVYINIKCAKDLFFLERKKERLKEEHRKGSSCEDLGIISYKILPSVEMRCIKVSNPNSLYITNDFVVTHNTAGAVLSVAEPVHDGRFRAVFLRNNLGDLKSGGGILDEFKNIYGRGCNVIESGDPHIDFPSGARIDVTHIADQSKEKVLQRFKGRQYDLIYFDEGTGFTWECFTAVYSRNRGTAKWTGKVRMTTNPKRSHWLRTFLDWYIGVDGFIIPERNGVVRYFFINGETVKDVVWGDSKEEVYQKCKIQIDRTLAKFNGKTGTSTYEDMIKSFTFYLGTMAENKAILGNNSGYVGSVAVMGGREAQANLEGNWNVDVDENLDAPIPSDLANQVFLNDDQRNGDKWVTCDLADTGTDNFLCIAWDGFHIIDILILGQTTPRQNAERLEMFAAQYNISNSHIIYDAIRGTYINDYIPEAIPFVSYRAPMGMYGRMAQKLKDECYLRLVEMIKRGGISISENIAFKVYEHQKLKEHITIQNEFLEECAVVRFKEVANGKKALLSKKEMNQKLGRGRSMDLLDPCAMRMLPILELPYGEELLGTMRQEEEYDDDYKDYDNNSVYNDSMWC